MVSCVHTLHEPEKRVSTLTVTHCCSIVANFFIVMRVVLFVMMVMMRMMRDVMMFVVMDRRRFVIRRVMMFDRKDYRSYYDFRLLFLLSVNWIREQKKERQQQQMNQTVAHLVLVVSIAGKSPANFLFFDHILLLFSFIRII